MSGLTLHALTPDRWGDLERLFGPRGACAGCWCMWFRQSKREFEAAKGEPNRAAFEAVVRAGPPPGLLAYDGDEPVGWCAVAPRSAYPRLDRSRVAKAVDDQPVWAITCFFVQRSHRGRGLSRALIEAAVEQARAAGAPAVEAYPVEWAGRVADAWAFHGSASTFRALGFEEVARRTPTRPVVRKRLSGGPTPRSGPTRGAAPRGR